jgi:cysteine desulfurase
MNSPTKIYLDYAATTPVHPRVIEVMLPYFDQIFGNPSSVHTYGQQAEAALENSREVLAQGLGCEPDEVIFTSCGSESDNLALRGVAFARRQEKVANHILISPVEHPAISRTASQLAEEYGFDLEILPVDEHGSVSPEDVSRSIRPDTAVVSIMHANNEIGTVNPIREIGEICRQRGIPFHTDAVQSAAHLSVNVKDLNVDLLSIGAHKFYGPKGVGALVARKGTRLMPTLTGGSQEHGLRAGTHNIPLIVGLAEAFRLAQEEREMRTRHLLPLRDRLVGQILEEIPTVRLTGHPEQRLPNHASFVFAGVDGNALLMLLDAAGFACSSGSACKTGSPEPSEVLTAMGFTREWALGSLRLTLGLDTTPGNIDAFLDILPSCVEKAQNLAIHN